jgi:ketosteroid isomerase-like protein
MKAIILVGLIVIGTCFTSLAIAASADEAVIQSLEDRFASAFNAGDVDAIMKVFVPDKSLVVFDVAPPRQYVGADAFRKDWIEFFRMFKTTPKFDISDLSLTVDSNVGFGHSIQHVVGIDQQGRPIEITVRVTDGFRKIGGNWLIAHTHVSVPVDLATGKPDLSSKP